MCGFSFLTRCFDGDFLMFDEYVAGSARDADKNA
jgi:hypothetical protein